MKALLTLVFLLSLVLIAIPCHAQLYFPLMQTPASVRLQGFGYAGAAYIGADSYTLNPATLALFSNQKYVAAAGYPVKATFGGPYWDEIGQRFYGISAGCPVRSDSAQSRFTLGVAYAYTRFGDFAIRTTVTTRSYYRAHTVTLAGAYRGHVDAGFGVNVRHHGLIIDSIPGGDNTVFNLLVDLGLYMSKRFLYDPTAPSPTDKIRWSITPAIGLIYQNLGTDIQVFEGDEGDPPPRTIRTGLQLNLTRWSGDLAAVSLTPMIEYEKDLRDRGLELAHFAGEIGIAETAFARVGRIANVDYESKQVVWGFTLSTEGMRKLINRGRADGERRGVLGRTTIEFSYANFEDDQEFFPTGFTSAQIGATYRF